MSQELLILGAKLVINKSIYRYNIYINWVNIKNGRLVEEENNKSKQTKKARAIRGGATEG